MLSHYNFVAELIILVTPAREFITGAVASGAMPTPPPGRTLAHLPAAHIAGVMSYLIAPIYGGGTVFWMRKYTWRDFLRLAGQCRITTIYTVPSIYLRMAKDPAVKDQFRWLYRASAGAAPIDGALQKAAGKKVGSGHVSQTWGLSETTGAVTTPIPGGEQDSSGSISPVVPNVELRFVDAEDKVSWMSVECVMFANVCCRMCPRASRERFWCAAQLLRTGISIIQRRRRPLLGMGGLQLVTLGS
jgi:acyl-CoA synthetase (AMP-forming)/AMP-acid ligase II